MQLMEYAPNSPSIQKRFGTAILHGNKMFPSLEYDWMQICSAHSTLLPTYFTIWNVYSVVAAMQQMEYAPNSPSIQKRFGIAILYGNKMFPSLEYDWMQIVHTPPCYLPISRFEMYTV